MVDSDRCGFQGDGGEWLSRGISIGMGPGHVMVVNDYSWLRIPGCFPPFSATGFMRNWG